METSAKKISEIFDHSVRVLERGWTQGANARNNRGLPVSDMADSAVSWCIVGAFQRTKHELPSLCEGLDMFKLTALIKEYNNITVHISDWNDDPEQTQADVIKAVREVSGDLRNQGNRLIDVAIE